MNKNDIYLIHGMNYKEMTKVLLSAANLEAEIGDKKRSIALKPNLAVSKSPDSGATTHGELLAGTIEYLQEHDFFNISIMEGSWVGDRTSAAFRAAGYIPISERYNVPLIDLQKDSSQVCDAKGMDIRVCSRALNADYIINMPVLKGHCQTAITCALKNNKGLIPNSEKRRFHTMGLHRPIAHLNTVVRNDFILVDNICGDLDFEEGGNPVSMNRILGCKDPVLCDAFVCDCLGYTVDDVRYIRLAEELGVGMADTSKANLIFLNEDRCLAHPPLTRRVRALSDYTAPKDACSACYGSLIHALNRLYEEGKLKKGLSPVCIGQGYRNQSGNIGVGTCTACFEHSLSGCPPKAVEILRFLDEEWV